MKTLRTLLYPEGVEGINQLQTGMKKHSADPDVQQLHNLCSCLRIEQPGMLPVYGTKRNF
ncbi:unnamed protein product [Urochloa decumbens]|uniref:Uncharacterized protein n=1 Tax=Urochloa decumbens TaxID=240449 RepID=A0ABC9AAT0_9POAL